MLDLGFARVARLSHKGLVREQNEDCTLAVRWDGGALLGVFDGMGGHRGGKVASRTARRCLRRLAYRALLSDEEGLYDLMLEGLDHADRVIRRAEERSWDLRGLGTTAVLACVLPDSVSYLHAGDCRFYHFRGKELLYVSRDHTIIRVLLDTGTITQDQVKTHPMRAAVTSSLGGGKDARLDVGPKWDEGEWRRECLPGDILVLSSDGLHGEIEVEALVGAIGQPDPRTIARTLVREALATGAKDNVSVIVVQYALEVGRAG
ncbi:MAG: protein phosphatase 2C domain-containing protein [Nitrospirae bacterium]|nr:protein phosphatase 2C domain-containing protein [Fimbriimonadaceae bacterium]